MEKQGIVLVIDDNEGVLTAVRMLLEPHYAKVLALSSPESALHVLREENVDVVLLDMNFSAGMNTGNEGLYWLSRIKKARADVAVVLFTAYADINLAVRGIKEGAADFVVKPWDNARLLATLRGAVQPLPVNQSAPVPVLCPESGMCWGTSVVMQELRLLTDKVARTDANILITGENGTGKEMLAREIHRLSLRRQAPMVSVDMGAIPDALFESELFGHVKGAFTDAYANRAGKFEAANGGTLFLDEIGNLGYALQAKLLAVLQNRSIVRVGNNAAVPVDIRLICATNKDLQALVEQGQFREDLLYRVNTIQLEIPPLRQHPEDIMPLGELFLAHYADRYDRPELRFSSEAMEKLKDYPWYGNVRELQHAIEKAVIISDTRILSAASFKLPRRKSKTAEVVFTLDETERNRIRDELERCKGNLTFVAKHLGITRQTLYNKLKRYGL